jgi:hypothetical protein
VEEFLSRAGVEFSVMNVDEDAGAYDSLLAHGFRTVPVTIIGEHALKGYDPAALQRAIDELRSRHTL